jgi:hypothetical protein
MKRAVVFALVLFVSFISVGAQNPEPAGWYAGDMHVHRSCGGSPESVPNMFNRMTPQKLAIVSQLADSGNGEVQDATTDLPLVNGQDDPISSPGQILHWDAEWHWDATYNQYPHQALGGHIVTLGLSSAEQLWQEYTYPILDWAHQHNGIAGFAHLQYLDGNGLPSYLTCCTPIEYPVEVALGAADFISEDVNDVNQPGTGVTMYSETPLQAYYKLLNSGFRPGLAAGTDYPCNGSDNGGALGGLLTYVQVAGGQLTYRNWIEGIANGRTVVSRNGHNEFLSLTVNGTSTPGDEIQLAGTGNVTVTVQWTAEQNWGGTIELVQNGAVVASLPTSAGPGAPATLTTTVNFAKSGWLAARRMGTNPQTGNYEHYLHTAAVFVVVNDAPVRASQADAQYFVNWTSGLLQNTSPGGIWNSFFPTSLAQAQARYQAAENLYQQIASEANGSGPELNSLALTPINQTVNAGTQASFNATGTYSSGPPLNITGQVRWASSNPAVATINTRGLVSAISPGLTIISASLSGVTGSTNMTVTASPLVISTQSLIPGTVGVSYSAALTATGGTLPYTWSITSGSLPNGLTINTSTGAISGNPSAAGTFNFVVQVSDSGSPIQAVTQALNIVIGAPRVCPCSIWPISATPGLADGGPDSPVELGVQFRSDFAGYITGVRFFKSAANIGTHVGNLWNSAGNQLATATFSGESTSGWQQVNFSTPVPINAGTVYVASYHTTSGHYAYDEFYFANQGVDNSPLHAPQDTATIHNGVFAYGSGGFPSQTWNSTNYWVDAVFVPAGPDTTPPDVRFVSPAAGSSDVDPQSSITATFSEALDPTTVNGTSMQLLGPSASLVAATVTYNSGTYTATLRPDAAMLNSTQYTVVIKGGIIKDVAGNALVGDYTWSFTTTAPPPPPPTEGPGGPILIVSSSTNPFSRYYTEILRNEGFNEFTAMDVSQVSASTLNNCDVVILGNFALTAAQAGMFTTWVNNGGNLIAMRPDKQLAALLGLTDTGTVLRDAYLLMNTASGPGVGLVNQAIQFHGTADLYTVSSATSLATLHSDPTASAADPAVTLNQAGSGLAAAFTYDLARSVVYTRQGNPEWSGEARDGQSGPMRSDDLFYGSAAFDPQPDYVDLNKVAIPQADEQQRLLANLIIQMNLPKRPLPRFWYFPNDFKAAVVMTGDDHGALQGGGATAARFDHYLSLSPAGCSVSDWQCVRASAYLIAPSIASNPLTNAQAASYIAQGFEVGVHVDSVPDCSDWTRSELASFYSGQISSFMSTYTSVPQPQTHRMHCVGWSDYDSQPQTELQNGIRLDTNYYYWPPSWVNDTPGMFTGSGMPMRFTKRDGTMLDIYQATTQMTDESGQSYPSTIDALLDNALGANEYYGYFTANMHNDSDTSDGADAIIQSAQSRGVPIISSAQLLTWLDGRNGSSFNSLSWNNSTLTFGIAPGSGAIGLEAMLPASSGSGTLNSISLNGDAVPFIVKTIKGTSYAVFSASAGTYQASYVTTTRIAVASITLNPSIAMGSTLTTGTVYLNGPAPSGGAQVTLSTSDNTIATLPSSTVTVPQGATSATFTVDTNIVTSTATVVISATYGGNTASANLTITSRPAVVSLTLNPNAVLGGASSTATVTLNQAAPNGGTVVNLASANTSVATVPATVTVAGSSTTGTFTVTTSPVSTTASATITASYSGSSTSASLTVSAPQVQSLSLSPAVVVGGVGNSTATITLTGLAPGGTVLTLSSSNNAAASVPSSITLGATSTTATFTVTSFPVSAATSVTISATYNGTASAALRVNPPTVTSVVLNPSSVEGGTSSIGTVTLSNPPAPGATVALSSSNTTVATIPANVTVNAGTTTAAFTVSTEKVSASTLVTISAMLGGGSASSQLTVTPSPTLSTLSFSPMSLVGGNTSTGTVRLTLAAPTGGLVIALSSANPSVATVPASVTVAAGSTSATFTIITTPVATQTAVAITASAGTVNMTATLTMNPPVLSGFWLSPTSVIGGTTSTGTLTLSDRAPTTGIVIALTSSNPLAVSVPASVTVPGSATTATFTITTYPVAVPTTSTISASSGNTTRTALIETLSVAAAPTFSPPGGTYSSVQSVTISDSTPGAVIYVTTDGTSPSQSSRQYAAPITVSSTMTIQAIAIAGGYAASPVSSATYTIETPVQHISQVLPPFTSAGAAALTVSISGSGFAKSSVAYWRGIPLETTYVSNTKLSAVLTEALLSKDGVTGITVQNLDSGAPVANTFQFEVDSGTAEYSPSFKVSSATVNAGQTARYSVTIPSKANVVSLNCLNLPAGANCSYLNGTVNIVTSSSTPTGNYLITSVFTVAVPTTTPIATILPSLPLLLFGSLRRRRLRRSLRVLFLLVATLQIAWAICGCTGYRLTPTHQVTESGAVTVMVK